MSPRRLSRGVLAGLAGLAAASYAVLVWGGQTYLATGPQTGGPFDLRAGGYDVEAARAYLAALTEEARAWYLGPSRWLDTVFPLAFATVLTWTTWIWSKGAPRLLRGGLAAVPLAYLVSDLVENARIAALLRTGPDQLQAADVAAASSATVVKFVCVGAALVILGGLGLRRRLRGRWP